MVNAMTINKRTFDIAEYSDKAREALKKLKATKQPGQQATGNKSDVLNAVKTDIKNLMDEGYTIKQIAEAFSADVFGILPKSITEIIDGKRRNKVTRKTTKTAPTTTNKEQNTQATNTTKQSVAGTIVIKPDNEDL